MSCYGKPNDKIWTIRLLRVGINCGFIPISHFGFLKNLGCCDAFTYVYDQIEKNNEKGQNTHGMFMDWDSCFDTIQHEYVIYIMEFEFMIKGNLLVQIKLFFTNRWIRVVVNGYMTK